MTVAYNPVLWSEDRAYANNLLESLLTLNRPTQNKQISRWIQLFFDPAIIYPLRKLKFVVHGPFMITRALLSFQRIWKAGRAYRELFYLSINYSILGLFEAQSWFMRRGGRDVFLKLLLPSLSALILKLSPFFCLYYLFRAIAVVNLKENCSSRPRGY